jgi:hypothetical protein
VFVTYSPADGDEQRWEFHAGEVLAQDAEAIEKAFVDTWDSWLMMVLKGGMRARRVLLWHCIKIQHPSLKFDDLPNFRVDELKVEYDRDELTKIREGIEGQQQLDDNTREVALAWLDNQLKQAPASTAGKARSKPKGSATPSPSPTTST